MAISLKKGQGVNLRKEDFDLSKITIGLGWDVIENKKGFFESIFTSKSDDYDLDAIAVLLGTNNKIQYFGKDDNGNSSIVGGDIVFFNSLMHFTQSIWLTGDNRTGEGDGDDEQIVVKLNEIPQEYAKILFLVSIYDADKRQQHFGNINNSFIRAVDARNKEICRFNLSGLNNFNNCKSLIFAEITRSGTTWSFNAIGTPQNIHSVADLIKPYLS